MVAAFGPDDWDLVSLLGGFAILMSCGVLCSCCGLVQGKTCMLRCFSVVRRALYIPGWLRCCLRREKWEDPQVFADRKLATHASLQYHKTKEEAESGTGSGAMNLSGSGWHFRLLPTPREAE